MIYAVANTKGGVGKTTIAVHLAICAMNVGTTLLIDADKQGSAACWTAWRSSMPQMYQTPKAVTLSGTSIIREGKDMSAHFNNTIIDVGGRDSDALRASLLLADKVIIPIGVSGLEAAALDDLLAIISGARAFNTNFTAKVLLAKVDSRAGDIDAMRTHILSLGMQVYDTVIKERVAYRRAVGNGEVVHDQELDKKAMQEITMLWEEVSK